MIETLAMKTGKKAYKVVVPGKNPFTGTKTSLVAGTYRSSFTNTVAIVILATIIFTLFNMMIPELYKSIRDMIMNVPSQMNRFIRELSEMNTENSTIGNIVESVMKEATTFVQNWMRTDLLGRINDFMSGLTVGVLNFMREIMNILIGLIVSVYVLFSKEKFSNSLKK